MGAVSVPYLAGPLQERLRPTRQYHFWGPFVSFSEEQGQVEKFQQFPLDLDAV
jgi:hypothetical protein